MARITTFYILLFSLELQTMYRSVKLITFDAMNTLFTTKHPPAKTYLLAAKALYPQLEEESEKIDCLVQQNFSSVFKKYYADYTKMGQSRKTSKDFWHNLIGETLNKSGVSLTDNDMKNVTNKLYKDYETTLHWEAYPEVEHVLQKLQGLKIRMGIVSNFDERLEKVLASLDLIKYFEFVVYPPVSGGIGKPDPRFYQLVVDRFANCRANEILHVGDSLQLDYEAAEKVGINGLLIDRSNQEQGNDFQTISSLNALPELL